MQKTLQFGLIRDTESSLAQQYKIKSYPALFVIKDGKPIKFDNPEFTYNSIFEFINVYSQVFIDPTKKENQSEVKTSSASKRWLVAQVPQMTQDSANDICLKKDGSLCIIMVVKDAASIDQKAMD